MIKKRNPIISLRFSVINAKEFFKMLCEIDKRTESMYRNSNIEDSDQKNSLTIRRALWIALVVEIDRLFDKYNKNRRKNISLKQTPPFNTKFKDKIDRINQQAIIGKIISHKNSFANHLSEEEKNFLSIKKICNSNLGKILNELDELTSQVEN